MKRSLFPRRIILFFLLILPLVMTMSGQDISDLKNQKPVTFHGSITNSFVYFNTGSPGSTPDFTWAISANATLSIYGFQLPFSFAYSATKVNYTQPFNQFGLSPKYKWITVHLGYRNITFSNYTLAGVTCLGAGIELNPGIFRMGFLWGRFAKSTSSDASSSIFTVPVLSRKGFAAKFGLGTSKNFVDLILLDFKDDSSTLKKSVNDSLTAPAANIVTGIKMHFTFAKPLTLDVEGALSMYTNDIRLTGFEQSSSDPWVHKLAKIISLNLSTEYYTALKATLIFKKPLFSFGLVYNRIDPDYKSMGIYYIDNDLENMTFNTTFSLFKRKFSFSGGTGLQHDNLRGNKVATSTRTIWNASVSINPVTWFGIDVSYSNFSTNQKAGRLPLVDSTKTYNVNRTLSVNPRFIIVRTKHLHVIIVSYNQNDYVDMNPATSGATTRATTSFLNYTLTFIPSQLSLTAGLSYINCINAYSTTSMDGGNAGISKSFFSNKLFCSINESFQHAEVAGQSGWVLNTSALFRYVPFCHHSFNLQIYFANTTFADKAATNMYNQQKGDLSYVFTF